MHRCPLCCLHAGILQVLGMMRVLCVPVGQQRNRGKTGGKELSRHLAQHMQQLAQAALQLIIEGLVIHEPDAEEAYSEAEQPKPRRTNASFLSMINLSEMARDVDELYPRILASGRFSYDETDDESDTPARVKRLPLLSSEANSAAQASNIHGAKRPTSEEASGVGILRNFRGETIRGAPPILPTKPARGRRDAGNG